MIPIFRPWFGDEEVDAVREVLTSGWVGPGPKVETFEERFAAYIGVRHAIGVSSCSAGLFLALKVLNVEGGEVVTTPMTFVATNHAILQNDATPVFCDIDAETMTIDPEAVVAAITDRTKAIMVMHYGGHPCDMDPILEAAAARGIPVVEDAAHAAGGRYNGKMVGSLGTIGCFSFHAIKNLSTCDGGMITTDDDALAERLKRLRWMGITRGTWERFRSQQEKPSWDYEVDEVGFKCGMNDLNAALGLIQLAKLESANGQRREIASQYAKAFGDLPWFRIPVERSYARSAYHAYAPRVDDRDGLIRHLATREIDASVYYKPNHLYSVYEPYRRPLPVTDTVWKQLVTIPLFPSMTEGEIAQVIDAVRCFQPNGQGS